MRLGAYSQGITRVVADKESLYTRFRLVVQGAQ